MSELLCSVLIAARKLTLAYKRIQTPLPCPIAIHADPRKGWYGAERPQGCLTAAERLLNKKIEVLAAPPLGNENPIAACVLDYGDKAEVYVSTAQNYCWQRFLVAKELAHLLICDDSNRTPITSEDVATLLSELINNVIPDKNPILQVESLAYIAAIEILLPMEHAEAASRRLAEGESILDVAKAYRLPKKVMEFRLSDPRVRLMFESAYQSHGFQHAEFAAVIGR